MPPTPEQLEMLRRASGLTLDAEGELLHEGEPIRHPGLHALFQSGLDVQDGGAAIVRVGEQWAYIQTPGTPFVVQRARWTDDEWQLALNTGVTVHVKGDAVQLRLRGGHELTVALPQPGRVARFGRRAWHALADDLEMTENGEVWLQMPTQRLRVHPG